MIIIASDGGAVKDPKQKVGYNGAHSVVVREVEMIGDKPLGWTIKNSFESSEYCENMTNNVAELNGYNNAIKYVLDGAIPVTVPILFILDSEYTLNCINKWYKAWKRSEKDGVAYREDWKTHQKLPVKNWKIIKDTRKALDKLIKKGYMVKTIHVHSHINEDTYGAELYRICHDNNLKIDESLFEIIITANDEADSLCTKALQDN
jgi:ribonuclease HI